jgi:hypothetical protein
MKLAHIADKVAADLYRQPINGWVSQLAMIRNTCDRATCRNLSISMLDRLSDMVERRLKKNAVKIAECSGYLHVQPRSKTRSSLHARTKPQSTLRPAP